MLLTLTMVFIISVSGITAAMTPSSIKGPLFAEMELHYSLLGRSLCRQVRLSNGSMLTTIPKLMKLISVRIMDRCQRDGISESHIICRIPDCLSGPCQRGWCEETMEGYQCHCPEGFSGNDCSVDGFINSLRLLGGNESEGIVAITSQSSSTTYMVIHQGSWSYNASRLVCHYLGFQGVYATIGGDLFDASAPDVQSTSVGVRCPDEVTNITHCWLDEREAKSTEESVAVVCCTENHCAVPRGNAVGLEDGRVPDNAITVSSRYSSDILGPEEARLNSPTSWCPFKDDDDTWLQIEMGSIFIISAIVTQGRENLDQWVTSYMVSSSLDDVIWSYYLDTYADTEKVFPGNYDQSNPVTHLFEMPIVCRFLKIHPKTNNDLYSCLRLELIGYGPLNDALAAMKDNASTCPRPIRGEPMGVEDGRIPNSHFEASSTYGYSFAYKGRLNANTYWAPIYPDNNQWVKIDLGNTSLVTGVIIQGPSHLSDKWVTSINISYSMDKEAWTFALETECGARNIYAGNYNRNDHVTIVFPEPFTARYVRIHPITWKIWPEMRYEVLGIM